MDEEELKSNPFAALFPTISVAQFYVTSRGTAKTPDDQNSKVARINIEEEVIGTVDPPKDDQVKEIQDLNNTIEEIFLVTLNKFSVLGGDQKQLVYLSSLADILGTQAWLDLPTLEQALFERVMLPNPLDHLVTDPAAKSLDCAHLIETQLVRYLAECFRRCNRVLARQTDTTNRLDSSIKQMKGMVVQNMVTAFREPDLYMGQDLSQQLCDLVMESYEVEQYLAQLLNSLAEKVKEEEKEDGILLEAIVYPVLDNMKNHIQGTSMILFCANTVLPLQYFLSSPILAKVFILHSYPKSPHNGKSFEETLIGSIFQKSCLATTESGSWDYFNQPSGQPSSVHGATEARIWSGLESVHSAGHSLLKQLLRVSEDTKHFTLLWLGDCLAANVGRGKMWTSQMGSLLSAGLASDGFMLNLGSTLLRLCAPMAEDPIKMNKVDPTYTAKVTVVSEDRRLAGVHMQGLPGETCLVGVGEAEREKRDTSASYNFPTEIFFMAHKTLDLGFRPVQEKFIKLNQELSRLQSAYRDAAQVGGVAAEQVQARMEAAMQKYLSLKAALLEPSTMGQQTSLMASTASWLVSLATCSQEPCLPAGQVSESDSPPVLACVPEFVMENLCEHLLLVKRFNPGHFEQVGTKLGSILMVILCYMDQPFLLRNPHLRARLAESLECLLPSHEVQGQPNSLGSYQRQALFQEHKYSLRIAEAILHVFVSIEETGQAVEFEQKFSYRRPMYDVIKYIWELDMFKTKLNKLAKQAEREIESEHPPLFLKFLNLLINDAIFLLDEGLNYMKQIQEKEGEREGWATLPPAERAEAESGFQHMGQLAKYHNLMGGETIDMLEMLTSSITAVITHSTIADRLAAMLNYFLKTLTGPERKSFKVSNLDKYSFKPGEVVSRITQIYLNLEQSQTFIKAISRDGRSYSPSLFSMTETVLIKVGRADLASALGQIAAKVVVANTALAEEEELLADCPEEFLCPIMSIVMMDPVKLPSSKQTVDRTTIARHLLSDQSDPFNRAPLTMDMVEQDVELKEKVKAWVEEKKSMKK
eukprot:GFUD01008727.1.p1 GENE.GFUD01008727.1~~GFUD01008727.1.p1  ORF type:complete len:1041 (+),score=441.41 GFUD01008727.1:59-3181(+)